MKIGITGGIGSGKSLVCNIFSILSVPIYYADSRAKYLMNEDPGLRSEIIDMFGEEAYDNQELNSGYISKILFHSPEVLDRLNRLVHPRVGVDFKNWCKNHEADNKYIIKEAALLFESGSYQSLDAIILVTAPEELRIARVLKRDTHRNKKDVLAIISKQLPEKEKKDLADYIITNDHQSLILPEVLKLHESFLEM